MRLGIVKVEKEHFVTITAGTLEQASLTDDEKEYLFSLLTGARAKLAGGVQPPPRVNVFAVFPHQLTKRERKVLYHLAMGKNNPEIARELFISINTVTRHITSIFTKTSTTNRRKQWFTPPAATWCNPCNIRFYVRCLPSPINLPPLSSRLFPFPNITESCDAHQ